MSATANGGEKAGEVGHRRHRSNSDPQATAIALAHLRNDEGKKSHSSGGTMRTGSLGSNSARSPMCPSSETSNKQSRLAMLGRLFKPWRWKRKKKSDKFEQTSRTLERKISMRATKEELIKKGVLLPESDKTALHKDSNHVDVPQVNGVVCGGTDGDVRVPPPPPSKPQFQTPESSNQIMGGGLTVPGISVLALPDLDEVPELTLSTLPDPPIAVSEIGPIPPPPMFSNPSPRFLQDLRERLPAMVPPHQPSSPSLLSPPHPTPGPPTPLLVRPPRPPDTTLIEEVPAKEPQFSAMPKKSALKKRSAGGVGPTLPPTGPIPVMPLSAQNRHPAGTKLRVAKVPLSGSDDNKENLPETAADLENMILWRDYYGEDEACRQVAKIARKDSLALKLSQRPDVKELIDKNILHVQTERERQETREVIGNRLIRRLSLRPTAEELEQRNILKNQTPEELRKEKEQKKKMLLRKLSFRPTIEELKERKIITFNDYVEVTQAQEYDRRADKPWTRLTPKDKAAIRKELNEFKSMEMAVHEESRHLTRFHRP